MALLFADVGRRIRPTPIPSDGPLAEALNGLVGGVPQAASIILGVNLAAILIDRRRLTDLGVDVDSMTGRRFAGGGDVALGAGIPMLSVVVGLATDYYTIVDFGMFGGPMSWMLILIATGLSILLTVISEDLLARGYLITNVIEALDGFPQPLPPRSAWRRCSSSSLTHSGARPSGGTPPASPCRWGWPTSSAPTCLFQWVSISGST